MQGRTQKTVSPISHLDNVRGAVLLGHVGLLGHCPHWGLWHAKWLPDCKTPGKLQGLLHWTAVPKR